MRTASQLTATDPDSASSRAYYAAFHALTALQTLRGCSFTKHSAVRAALHRDLVNPGHLSVRAGEAYDFLFNLRAIGDYGGLVSVSNQDSEMAVRKAEGFLKAISLLAPELSLADDS